MILLLQDPGGAQIGFLLGSLGVTVALSSEVTTKALPKEEGKDHIVHFRGKSFPLSYSLYLYFMCMRVCVCVCVCVRSCVHVSKHMCVLSLYMHVEQQA